MTETVVRRHARKRKRGGVTIVRRHSRWVLPPDKEWRNRWSFRELQIGDEDIPLMSVEAVPIKEYWGTSEPTGLKFAAFDVYGEDAGSRRNMKMLADRMRAGKPVDPVGAVVNAVTGNIEDFDGGHRTRAAAIANVPALQIAVSWQVANPAPNAGKHNPPGVDPPYVPKEIAVPRPANPPRIRWRGV